MRRLIIRSSLFYFCLLPTEQWFRIPMNYCASFRAVQRFHSKIQRDSMLRFAAVRARRFLFSNKSNRYRLLAAGYAAFGVLAAGAALAQQTSSGTPIIRKGDAAVTSFAGASPPTSPPAGMHPLDATVIDIAKPTLQIFDLSKLGGPPTGQLANAPVRFEAKASDIGHVFAVTTDAPVAPAAPNVYVGATSLFGLQIVEMGADGKPKRLVNGSPRAQWMPGQFGLEKKVALVPFGRSMAPPALFLCFQMWLAATSKMPDLD